MNANKKPNQKPKVVPIRQRWWHSPFYKSLLHVVSTTVTAAVIGLAAFGLDFLATWMAVQQASDFVVSAFHLFANTLLVIDCVWFVGNIIRHAYKDWLNK